MKKTLVCSLLALLLLAGCSRFPADDGRSTASNDPAASSKEQGDRCQETGSTDPSLQDAQDTEEDESSPGAGTAIPGSYTVPEGWVKSEKYSTSSQIFYVKEGHEEDAKPDNIAICVGTNKYSAENHAQFREAIVRQLLGQLQGVDAELLGDGTFTEQEYMVYIFTIDEKDVITKQYYIVDDFRYCLIHLTNFSRAEDADQAAQAIMDSFVWE